jgi:1,4-dihydroxy-2-naphthoate octaprenyltransferase
MLSGLLLLAGYFIYHNSPGVVWFVALGATLVSVYGQLYNQLRDYEMDKAAGLNNTAIVLGENNTRRAMYLSVALAGVCLLVAIVQGVFPAWLAFVLAAAIAISMLFRPQTDMRGSEAVEVSGMIQVQSLIVLNLTITVWLGEAVLRQVFLS